MKRIQHLTSTALYSQQSLLLRDRRVLTSRAHAITGIAVKDSTSRKTAATITELMIPSALQSFTSNEWDAPIQQKHPHHLSCQGPLVSEQSVACGQSLQTLQCKSSVTHTIKHFSALNRSFSTAVATQEEQRVERQNLANVDRQDGEMFPTIPSTKQGKQRKSALKRSSSRLKDPIIVTERAAARIRELMNGTNGVAAGAIGLRLGVKRRGCNGLSYTLNYATHENQTNSKDVHVLVRSADGCSDKDVHVYIEPMALFNVVGTVMDFEENDMGSEFTFNNPNSKGSCGCGESFNV